MGPQLTLVSRIMGFLVASIGASVLLGWALDVPLLKSVHPAFISMKANTALAFVLLGMALAGGGAGAFQRSLARVSGALVALLGAASLIQYEFGVDLHIDGLLFREPAGTLLTKHPGRLSFIAGMGLLLLGVAVLLAVGFRRAARLASSFAAASFGLALVALAGYAYGVSRLYDLAYGTPIALNSAVALLLGSMSVLTLTHSGIGAVLASRGSGGVLARRLLPFAVTLPVALDLLVQEGVRLRLLDAAYEDAIHGVALSGVLACLILFVARRMESADEGRRRVGRALEASEAHWRSLFENMTNGCAYHRLVFEGDAAVDYVFLEVNSSFEQQTGLRRDVILGRRATEIIPRFADSDRELIARYAEVARTGKAVQFDHYSAGMDRWFSVSAFSQQHDHFATAFLDITDHRRRAEEVSQQLEIIRHMGNDILLLVAPDCSIVQANDRALKAYGYAEDELLRLNLRDIRAPETRAELDGGLQVHLSKEGSRFETLHVRRDGSTFPVEVSTRWMEIGGRPLVQGVVRDLTEERAARAATEYQAMLLDNLHDAVVGVDAGLRVNAWNRAAERIFGWTREEATGRTIDELLPSEYPDGSTVREVLSRAARAGRASVEVRRRTRSGAWVDIEATVVPLRGDGRAVVGYVSVNRDMTEQRKAQEELLQAQKLEAVGRLASGIAHEINTPIQFIGDSTHFLGEAFAGVATLFQRYRAALEGGAAESQQELQQVARELDAEYLLEEAPKCVKRTLEGVHRVTTIVRAMKEFAHPGQPEMVATDLNRALQATLEVARSEYKYVATVETAYGELPAVLCRASDLNQVFLNLIVNAAHAVEGIVKGTSQLGTIRIATRVEAGQAVIAISDTGCGIPEEIRAKVFEPFFTTKEVGRGTGQGLSIARGIVVKHGGQLSFTSTVGQGTTFFIRLPIPAAGTPADH